jgi:membrane protease subunit HflK
MKSDFPSIDFKLPKIKGGVLKIVIAAVIVLILLFGSFYQIGPEEIGVILRFGKFVRTTGPGLHLKLPLGIENLTKVPVQRQLKMEFGFRTARPGIRTEYRVTSDMAKEAIMLTGDLNVAVCEWNEAVVRKIVGDNSVDEVLTIGRARIAAEAKDELQKLCDLYEIGIEVNQLILQDVNPPDSVKPSFNDVNEALQEKEKKINESWAEYNHEIPKATGEAEQMIRAAEGYATERVNRAKGEANRFISIYKEYAIAPLVTRKRLYLETINEVLPKISKKIIFDERQKNILPLLNLGKEEKK